MSVDCCALIHELGALINGHYPAQQVHFSSDNVNRTSHNEAAFTPSRNRHRDKPGDSLWKRGFSINKYTVAEAKAAIEERNLLKGLDQQIQPQDSLSSVKLSSADREAHISSWLRMCFVAE
jgi:hypothetical protein